MLDGSLGGEKQAENIEVELLVEVLGRDLFKRAEFIDSGIVDQNVDRTELFSDGLDEGTD